jgi:hypothetical protein
MRFVHTVSLLAVLTAVVLVPGGPVRAADRLGSNKQSDSRKAGGAGQNRPVRTGKDHPLMQMNAVGLQGGPGGGRHGGPMPGGRPRPAGEEKEQPSLVQEASKEEVEEVDSDDDWESMPVLNMSIESGRTWFTDPPRKMKKVEPFTKEGKGKEKVHGKQAAGEKEKSDGGSGVVPVEPTQLQRMQEMQQDMGKLAVKKYIYQQQGRRDKAKDRRGGTDADALGRNLLDRNPQSRFTHAVALAYRLFKHFSAKLPNFLRYRDPASVNDVDFANRLQAQKSLESVANGGASLPYTASDFDWLLAETQFLAGTTRLPPDQLAFMQHLHRVLKFIKTRHTADQGDNAEQPPPTRGQRRQAKREAKRGVPQLATLASAFDTPIAWAMKEFLRRVKQDGQAALQGCDGALREHFDILVNTAGKGTLMAQRSAVELLWGNPWLTRCGEERVAAMLTEAVVKDLDDGRQDKQAAKRAQAALAAFAEAWAASGGPM